MRANTIALRRIAEQNHADAQHAKMQSELAYKSSRSMTKIAYLTMIYLPASFVAVSILICQIIWILLLQRS
jgi:hypothetical protein